MKILHLAIASLLGVVSDYADPNGVVFDYAASTNLNASPTFNTPTSSTDPEPCFQPRTDPDPKNWTNDTDIEKMIIPQGKTPIFWMGHVPNSNASVIFSAQECAKRKNGVTIGMVMCQNNFVGPPPPSATQSPEAERWNHLVSRVYAQKTIGVAWTIAGNFTSTSDYLIDEFPALVENPEAAAVFGIHPNDSTIATKDQCEPFCYWHCAKNTTKLCQVRTCFHGLILLSN